MEFGGDLRVAADRTEEQSDDVPAFVIYCEFRIAGAALLLIQLTLLAAWTNRSAGVHFQSRVHFRIEHRQQRLLRAVGGQAVKFGFDQSEPR
mgnify:FL=1